MKDFPTCIYVIGEEDDESGPVKVGLASNLRQRRSALQTGNHRELVILDSVPGDRVAEIALHELLLPWRIRLEWYTARDLITHFFDALRERMYDHADLALGADWTPAHPGLEDHFYANCAKREDINHVWGRVKPFFDFIWAGGDLEDWPGTPEEQAEMAEAAAWYEEHLPAPRRSFPA